MIERVKRQREQPLRLVTLVAAVWLATIAVVAGYAENAPMPVKAAAAVHVLADVN